MASIVHRYPFYSSLLATANSRCLCSSLQVTDVRMSSMYALIGTATPQEDVICYVAVFVLEEQSFQRHVTCSSYYFITQL